MKIKRSVKESSQAPYASKGGMAIYQSKDKKVQLEVKLDHETIWLSQAEIAKLFDTERSVVTKHISNVFQSHELEQKSNVQKMHVALSDKPVKYYNLDVIISVGYRVNSNRATQFRIWATSVLRKHIVDGYTLNEKRILQEKSKIEDLRKAIKLIGNVKHKVIGHEEALGLLEVIENYSQALELLDDYDHGQLKISQISKTQKFKLTYEKAIKAIGELKKKFGGSNLFAQEKDQSFKSSIASIYQTFSGKDLYPSVEEKAAHLLYFIVKNHSFVDGNKRIAASVFLWFLEKNALLYREDKSKRIADNALVALTLMIAESNPREMETITKVIVNLINRNN